MKKVTIFILFYCGYSYSQVIVQNLQSRLEVPKECYISGVPTNPVNFNLGDKNIASKKINFNISCNMDDKVDFAIVSEQYDKGFYIQNLDAYKLPIMFNVNSEKITDKTITLDPNQSYDMLIQLSTTNMSVPAGSYTGHFALTVIY